MNSLGFPFYATNPFGMSSNGGSSVAGHIPQYTDTSGLVLEDSGFSTNGFLKTDGSNNMNAPLYMDIHDIEDADDIKMRGDLVGLIHTRSVEDIVSSNGSTGDQTICIYDGVDSKQIQSSGVLLSSKLNVDGSLPMTGDLDMDGNEIKNATIPGLPYVALDGSNNMLSNLNGGSFTFLMKNGEPTVGSKFIQKTNATVLSNSTVETSWFNGSTSVGSLVFAAPQTVGTSIRFAGLAFIANMITADTLTIRLKNSSGTVLTHVLTCPSTYVNKIMWFECNVTSRNATDGLACSRIIIDGEVNHLSAGQSTWDVSISNTWDITLQFSVADPGNAIQTNDMVVDTIYEL